MSEELDLMICPICECETLSIEKEQYDRICINKCVEFSVSHKYKVFGIRLLLDKVDRTSKYPGNSIYYFFPRDKDELKERIDYWKENDRYLIEFMTK